MSSFRIVPWVVARNVWRVQILATLSIYILTPTAAIAETKDSVDGLRRQLIHAAVVYDEKQMHQVCSQICVQSSKAIPMLCDSMLHENGVVRWKAVETLGRIGPVATSSTTRQQLHRRLNRLAADADPDVRAATALCLARWFPSSQQAKRAIAELTQDRNGVVRANAWYVTWVLGNQPAAVSQLVALLPSKDWMAAEQAEALLARIGAPAEDILLARCDSMAIESVTSGTKLPRCVRVLGTVSQSSKVRLRLNAYLDHCDLTVAREAAMSLVQHKEKAVDAFIAMLSHKEPARCVIALRCLERIGAAAKDSAATVRELLACREQKIRLAAIATLPALTNPDEDLLQAYVQLLSDRERSVRAATLRGLQKWGSGANSVAPYVRKLIEDESQDYVQHTARKTLDILTEFEVSN